MDANLALTAALARLTPEQRARLSRAGAEAVVAAIDALVASQPPKQPQESPAGKHAPHPTPARS
jgi:hypothetical protein